MKKIMTLIIGVSLLIPSGVSFAKEKHGAQLVITKTNGTEIRGELIGLKQDSTLILESSSRIGASIDISDIKVIKIVKGSIPVAGVIVGLVGGGVMGQALAWISTDNNLVKVGPNETGPSSSIATINYPTKVQLQVDPKAPKPG